MAQQVQGQFSYQNIQLIKAEQLGTGSYGAVYKARCDDLPCAGKILHPALFQSNDPRAMTVMRRFQQECSFLSVVRHPNIVQYLGSYQDPETRLPVLLMELMDESLSQFLRQSQEPLPYHSQVKICHDIALAIAYLHLNDIIHRDLSSNNVLLIGAGNRVKVTDFGMAKLFDAKHTTPQTQCPGTKVYMPPEALNDPPVYTKKLDTFSFGVLGIQIITRQFPDPGPRTKQVQDPRDPKRQLQEVVPETERRKSHIDLIDPTHPLVPISMSCLSNNEEDRPSAQELCHHLAALKETPQYGDSVQQAQERTRVATEVEKRIRELQQENKLKQEMIQKLQEENQCLQKQLQVKDKVLQRKLTLKWEQCEAAPDKMKRGSAIVCGSLAYFRPAFSRKLYSYNLDKERWSILLDCPQDHCILTVINGIVTVVGGEQSSSLTNKLLSLAVSKNGRWEWVEHFPPMKIKRRRTAVVYSGKVLLVVGGEGKGDTKLATVEVMDMDTLQWSTVSSLPQPLSDAIATVCGDRIYVIGGKNKNGKYLKSVLTCSLNDLLKSQTMESIWHEIANLPITLSTSVILNGQLLAVGGMYSQSDKRADSKVKSTNEIFSYDTEKNSWEVIDYMPTARYWCLVAVLPGNKMMVVGGCNDLDTKEVETNIVEIATVL